VASIDGLYLNFAVICEKVLREADEVLSFIRIIDQLTLTLVMPPGVDLPADLLPAPPATLTFAIGLKSAGYVGPVPVKLWVDTPAGSRLPEYETRQQIGGVDGGLNLIFPMQFPVQDEGVYWFVVEVSGEVVTRVPLRINKQVGPQAVPPQGS
jgi:hypothetical protein